MTRVFLSLAGCVIALVGATVALTKLVDIEIEVENENDGCKRNCEGCNKDCED